MRSTTKLKADLSVKTIAKKLNELLEQRERVYSQMDNESEDPIQLSIYSNQVVQLDKQIRELQAFYIAHLLESLEFESRKLKWLTAVLIVLTAVLIVFAAFHLMP
jgi:flagellar biosynthesis chaperone FliJ